MKNKFRLTALLAVVALLSACGGGSSPEATQTPPVVTVSTKATVAIVLTDAPIDDYDHAYVTITSVELLGGSDRQLIFSGDERVDLLALRDSLTLFAVSEDIDPGEYSKIRIEASDMELVVDNDDGSTTVTPVDLVANGKIDLNPRGPFTLAAGDVVFVSLDWDMNESLKLTQTGNGRLIMRPVIFIDVGTEPGFKEGLVRVFGLVDLRSSDLTAFRICSPDVSTLPANAPVLGSLCLDVLTGDKTGLFGADGQPVTIADLAVGDPVTVLGLLRRAADGPPVPPMDNGSGVVSPTTFQVAALVVEGGPKGTWLRHRGTVTTVVDDVTDIFDFKLDEPQGDDVETVLSGQLFAKSRIFRVAANTGVSEVAAADLMVDDRAGVDAVQTASDNPELPDVLNIAIMLARTPGETDLDHLKGRILSVDAAANAMMVSAATGDFCVTTDVDTAIFRLFVSDDIVESVPSTLAELTAGSLVAVSGVQQACLEADLIIAEAQSSAP